MINKQIKLYTRQELSKNIQYFMRYSRFYHIRKSSKIRIVVTLAAVTAPNRVSFTMKLT